MNNGQAAQLTFVIVPNSFGVCTISNLNKMDTSIFSMLLCGALDVQTLTSFRIVLL